MRFNESLFFIVLSVVILIFCCKVSSTDAAPPWLHEIPMQIVNDSTALSDYQVLVALTPATFDYAEANPDGSDLRFTDGTKTVFYDYWIETWNPSGDSTIWVKIPSIPSGTALMYMWHGNPGAGSQSNGSATFDFFDDFDDGDIADWDASCIYQDVPGEHCDYLADNGTYASGQYSLALYGWASCGGPTYNGVRPTASRTLALADGTYRLDFFQRGWGGQWGYCSSGYSGENWAYADLTNIYSSDTCHYTGCSKCSTSWSNAVSDTFTVSGGTVTLQLIARITDCEEGWGWFDDVRVRKCTSPGPVVAFPATIPDLTTKGILLFLILISACAWWMMRRREQVLG